MEELKLPENPEEEAEAGETMKRMKEAADAEVKAKIQEIPKDQLNDQWKRGGICAMCRRQDYCKTKCTANRKFVKLRIREYLRRKGGIMG